MMETWERIVAALGRCDQAHTYEDGRVSALYLTTEDAGEILAQASRAKRQAYDSQGQIERLEAKVAELQESLRNMALPS